MIKKYISEHGANVMHMVITDISPTYGLLLSKY